MLLPHSSAVRHYRFAVGESQMPTLLFSDIQGSTSLLQRVGPLYEDLLSRVDLGPVTGVVLDNDVAVRLIESLAVE